MEYFIVSKKHGYRNTIRERENKRQENKANKRFFSLQ